MERDHRNKIINNIDKLVQSTTYDDLMKECIDRKLLFDVMKREIEKYSPNRHTRHGKLLEKITHRGPKAYETFLSILNEKFPDAFNLLLSVIYDEERGGNYNSIRERFGRPSEPQVPINNQATDENANENFVSIRNSSGAIPRPTTSARNSINNDNNNTELIEYIQPVNPQLKCIVTKSTKFHGQGGKVSPYNMTSKNRGVLFLVNNIHFKYKKNAPVRNGAETDRDNLIDLFRQMGFKIFYYEDLTTDEFTALINKLVISKHLHDTDCLVFGLMSHGEKEYSSYNVEFVDSKKIDIENILMKFSNKNCGYLASKPKIFIFPFCRGLLEDGGVMGRQRIEHDHIEPIQNDAKNNIAHKPSYSDIKICYASLPGYTAFRHPAEGSWYVQIMCEVLAKHAHDTDLEQMLKIIGNTLSTKRTERGKMQTSSNEDRGFDKDLYFNPGYYGEN